MEFKCALLKVVLISYLAFQADADQLTVDSEPGVYYVGKCLGDGKFKITDAYGPDAKPLGLTTSLGHLKTLIGQAIQVGKNLWKLCDVKDEIVIFAELPQLRFCLEPNSKLFYYGTRLGNGGAMAVTQVIGPGFAKSVQEAGNDLVTKKPNFIYIDYSKMIRKYEAVDEIGVESFTVKYSQIPFTLSIETLTDTFSGNVYQEWCLEVFKKNKVEISDKDVDKVHDDLEAAMQSIKKISLNGQQCIYKMTKLEKHTSSVFVFYSNADVSFVLNLGSIVHFSGHYTCPGEIAVTDVYVGENKGLLKDYYKFLKTGEGEIIYVGQKHDKYKLNEVSPFANGQYKIKYSEVNTE